RLFPPAHNMFRTAVAPARLRGADIEPGDKVMMVHAAANRDETKYECPAEFRLDRSHEPTHLAFGVRPHFCAGAHLARAEMRLTLEALLRHPRFELADHAGHTPHLMMGQMFGVEHLPLRFVKKG